MPTYEYGCENCDIVIHVRHSIHEDPDNIVCDICGDKLERLISGGTGVIFAEGNDAISSKPDSYFENAEKERLKKLKQRQDMVKEKLFYKDKKTIEQAKQQIINKQRMATE